MHYYTDYGVYQDIVGRWAEFVGSLSTQYQHLRSIAMLAENAANTCRDTLIIRDSVLMFLSSDVLLTGALMIWYANASICCERFH
jgi:hypothetical protein